MTLRNGLETADADAFGETFDALFNNPNADVDFMQKELSAANNNPLLRVLDERVEAALPRLALAGFSADQLAGIRAGVDMVRITMSAFASSEPD